MKRIFIDTNVVIDFLADRKPFSTEAAKLFDLAVKNKIVIYISAVSYNNIYYILRQSLGNKTTITLLEELAGMTEIIDVTGFIIRNAIKADFSDYEDAIQYHCALSAANIEWIVTRNAKDFRKSALPVLTPVEALAALKSMS